MVSLIGISIVNHFVLKINQIDRTIKAIFIFGGIEMKKAKKIIFPLLFLAVLDALTLYVSLPTLNFHNPGMWLITLLNIFFICLFASGIEVDKGKITNIRKIPVVIVMISAVVFIIGALASSQIFNAKAYRDILTIETLDEANLPDVSDLNRIPLMDTESSKVLGNRKIGALNEIVSQFEVSENYMTIAYKDMPVKVSPLIYAGFWKWNNNRTNGIPGYVLVEPNDLTAEYIKLSKGMKYVPSAFFGQDLARHIYFRYPTTFYDNIHFEIDEEGNPFYVATTYTYSIGLFGGKKITGAIVIDPVTGSMNRYTSGNLPEWVDIVYNGDYIANYFDIYGRLINGYWNSHFGQKGLIESTTTTTYDSEGNEVRDHDFGYIVKDSDVLIYTGITAVTNDESNIGYLMANERTGEVKISYFESTDEDSVMRAAEGEVQEKRYRASFPSLINVNGTPAYVMVLKDNLGLVKMYAIVDAAQYSHMVVDDSLQKAVSLFAKGSVIIGSMEEKTVTIKRVELITTSGDTVVYIVDGNNNIYSADFEPSMLLLEEEQTIKIYTDGQTFSLEP